jgi:hypothetical protein
MNGIQKYVNGDCRRRFGGNTRVSRSTSRGAGSGGVVSFSSFRAAGTAPDAGLPIGGSPVASAGAGLSTMAGMMLLAKLIGRKRGR